MLLNLYAINSLQTLDFIQNLRDYKFAQLVSVANIYVICMLRKLIALFWINVTN